MKFFNALRDFFKPSKTTALPAEPVDTRDRWHLLLGDKFLGELVYVSYETPWVTADFYPQKEFSRYIPYFDWDKQRAAHMDDENNDEADEPSEELALLIDEVHSLGGIRIVDLKNNQSWEPGLNFWGDYTYATFR